MSHMDAILAKVGEIKPLPGTVLRLIQVINDPRSTVNDIVETIRYDQAITSQILRICNSAYFGLSREIHSLNEAIRYLGMIKILQLVMAVHTNALLAKRQPGYDLAPGVLWKHSVAVAVAASIFAERLAMEKNASVAFTAGLLHDVGKVVLSEHVAAEFSQIVARVTEKRLSFLEAEHDILGFSHCEIGAKVAEAWKIPEQIVRCIEYHHEPRKAGEPNSLLDAVYLANVVCLLVGVGLGADGLDYRADPVVMERHGLAESDIEFIGAQTMIELKNVEQTFADSAARDSRELFGVK
jgi:putative nucleotidyltransferase with HDIG domain